MAFISGVQGNEDQLLRGTEGHRHYWGTGNIRTFFFLFWGNRGPNNLFQGNKETGSLWKGIKIITCFQALSLNWSSTIVLSVFYERMSIFFSFFCKCSVITNNIHSINE